jgi:hypothetical protein
MQDYRNYLANQQRINQVRYLDHTNQPEALSTTQYEKKLYGGKPLRRHPLPGRTSYSQGPNSLYTGGPNLLQRTFKGPVNESDDEFSESEDEAEIVGAGFWGDVGRELKSGLSKAGKEVFHDVIVPVGTSMAKDYVKKKMGGKRHYVHHDKRLIEPEELGLRVEKRRRGRPRKNGGGKVMDVFKSIGRAAAPIAKDIFHDVIVPEGTRLAKDYVKKKMGGKRHYVHHDKRLIEPAELGERVEKRRRGRPRKNGGGKVMDVFKSIGRAAAPIAKDIFHDVIVPEGTRLAKDYVKKKMGGKRIVKGAGFWKDFGEGFKKGIKMSNKVASKVLPIATIFQPELAPFAAASVAADKAMGGARSGGAAELYPPAVMGMSGGSRKSQRGELIKQIMKKTGCNLGQASALIKQKKLM